jgi:hypothetical protein
LTAALFGLELAEVLTATLLTIFEIGFFAGLAAAVGTAFGAGLANGLEIAFAVSLLEGLATDLALGLALGLAADLGIALATALSDLEDFVGLVGLVGLATGLEAALGLGFEAAIVFFLPSD